MKYIVAVSGGVDSVVLLDQLMKKKLSGFESAEFAVAHFDHGVRDNSSGDAAFVQGLTSHYKVPFELGVAKLGAGVSEEVARDARYAFLREVQKKHRAVAVITAHHKDDVIETAIINILRGTGWRGLTSLDTTKNITRPLLHTSKQSILQYAADNGLKWKEDSTNEDERYLRNQVRRRLIPAAEEKDALFKTKLIDSIVILKKLKKLIDQEVADLLSEYVGGSHNEVALSRYRLIMWPPEVAAEIVYSVLLILDDDWHPSRLQIRRSLHFIKTAKIGKTLQISKQLHIKVAKGVIRFKKV